MGIDVAWIDALGEIQQEVGDSHEVVSRLSFRWSKLTNTVCLRFVVPWGDAVFNQAQMAELLTELRSEAAGQASPQFREHLEKIIELVENASAHTHAYVKFIGD